MKGNDFLGSLRAAGLSAQEARVYGALVERSPSGAAAIAKRCGMSRSSVYTVLYALEGKGLVGTTHQNEVKQFVAEGHAALVDHAKRECAQAEQRMHVAEGLAAAFAKTQTPADSAPELVTFEGAQGLRRIYLSMLRDAAPGSVMRILRDEFVWSDDWRFVFESPWRDRVRKIKTEKRLSTRLLINDSTEERRHSSEYRSRAALEVRRLPREASVRSFALYVVDGSASVLSFERDHLAGVRLANGAMAENLRTLFDYVWSLGRPLRAAVSTSKKRAGS